MFKVLKLLKNPRNGRLNNLNDPVLSVLVSLLMRACVALFGSRVKKALIVFCILLISTMKCSFRKWV